MTATACYTCEDECTGNLSAEFDGKLQPVCHDCFMGISNGLDVFQQINVSGEKPDK